FFMAKKERKQCWLPMRKSARAKCAKKGAKLRHSIFAKLRSLGELCVSVFRAPQHATQTSNREPSTRYHELSMRIVSLQPSITLTIAALDRLDTVCGLTKYCIEAMPELASLGLPVLHDSWTANPAEIVACQPDLVIASVPYRMESLATILKSGLPVLALAPHSLADIF